MLVECGTDGANSRSSCSSLSTSFHSEMTAAPDAVSAPASCFSLVFNFFFYFSCLKCLQHHADGKKIKHWMSQRATSCYDWMEQKMEYCNNIQNQDFGSSPALKWGLSDQYLTKTMASVLHTIRGNNCQLYFYFSKYLQYSYFAKNWHRNAATVV